MFASLLNNPDVRARVDRLEIPFGSHGHDCYGVSRAQLTKFFSLLRWLYCDYFHVSVAGAEHVPPRGRAMLVGNHSGGIALDAAMVSASMLLELEPPRLAQGMADKFINRVPFASLWTSRCGQFTGLPEHALRLLADERLLLVFPEGASGTAKLYWDRNTLVRFGSGFMRLAMTTRTPIIPFGFVGGGEAIPTIRNLRGLGRLVGVPYVPITPYLLLLPRRVPLAIHYGEPMTFDGSGAEDDDAIGEYVDLVKTRIAALMKQGEAMR